MTLRAPWSYNAQEKNWITGTSTKLTIGITGTSTRLVQCKFCATNYRSQFAIMHKTTYTSSCKPIIPPVFISWYLLHCFRRSLISLASPNNSVCWVRGLCSAKNRSVGETNIVFQIRTSFSRLCSAAHLLHSWLRRLRQLASPSLPSYNSDSHIVGKFEHVSLPHVGLARRGSQLPVWRVGKPCRKQ